ncbi:MAG: DUF3530 family protein [Gammaproteobacteria bacterium]|nr:DUF3530 family protein [Gammaproteobacteria bacterium]
MRLLIILMVLFGTTIGVVAADLPREQRIAGEIVDSIVVGDPVWLGTEDGQAFLAIYTAQETAKPEGGLIILHGRNAHPDWVGVVQPLRTELPASGWVTLSLQLPVAAVDAPADAYDLLVSESYPRIMAGIQYLKERDVTPIVLLGHSLGARIGLAYLASNPQAEVGALVAVGLPIGRSDPREDILGAIEKLRIPILDIYGSRDLQAVTQTARERAAVARRSGNEGYQQQEISGADHFFRGLDDTLVTRVRAWLKRWGSVPRDAQAK